MLQGCRLRTGSSGVGPGLAVVEGHGLSRARHLRCAVARRYPAQVGLWWPWCREDWPWGIVAVVVLPVPVPLSHARARGPEAVRHAGHVVVVVIQRVLVVEDIGIGGRAVAAAALAAVHRVVRASLSPDGRGDPLQAAQVAGVSSRGQSMRVAWQGDGWARG